MGQRRIKRAIIRKAMGGKSKGLRLGWDLHQQQQGNRPKVERCEPEADQGMTQIDPPAMEVRSAPAAEPKRGMADKVRGFFSRFTERGDR